MHFERCSRRAVGSKRDESVSMVVVDRPECESIGFREGKSIDGLPGVESEGTLVDGWGQRIDRPAAIEEKHEPVAASFVSLFCDHRKEVEVRDLEFEPDLLTGFADRALVGRFADAHFELAPDRTPLP